MFSKSLSAFLFLAGLAVAAVQRSMQDSDSISRNLAEDQVPLPYSSKPEVANIWDGIPFEESSPLSNFQPVGELSALGSDEWSTLRHPVFPNHSVRIKRSYFCDPAVK